MAAFYEFLPNSPGIDPMALNLKAAGMPTRASIGIDLGAEATVTQTAVICASAALLSCLFAGYVFGVSNQQFYLPIIDRLYDEPQFADDVFMQSLRYFASGIWLAIGIGPKYSDGGYALLLALFFLSRLSSFIGFVCCASLLGVTTVRDRLIFCAIVCFTALLDGNSFAGHGGLFVPLFTHSEVANGTTLLAIYFAIRGRFTAALFWTGATFFINAFMGVWLAPVLLLIAITRLRSNRITIYALLRQAIPGAALAAIFAAPIVINVLANPELHTLIDFDYVAFLREFYGSHFLIDSNSAEDIVLLLSVTWLGWLSFRHIETPSSQNSSIAQFRAAFLAIVAVYVIGVFVPYMTSNPNILKLHLLRSSAVIQLLAVVGVGALATQWLVSSERSRSTVGGPLLVLFVCTTKYLLPVAAVFVALTDRWQGRSALPALRIAVFTTLALVIIPTQFWKRNTLAAELNHAVADWQDVGAWAKSTTSPDAMFLILTSSAASLQGKSEAEIQHALELTSAASIFQVASHRRIFVDFYSGATAFLTPSFYDQWHRRITEVMTLRTLPEKVSYARANGIQYIVDDCSLFPDAAVAPAFRSGDLCALATGS
jgi:hypothetical protein